MDEDPSLGKTFSPSKTRTLTMASPTSPDVDGSAAVADEDRAQAARASVRRAYSGRHREVREERNDGTCHSWVNSPRKNRCREKVRRRLGDRLLRCSVRAVTKQQELLRVRFPPPPRRAIYPLSSESPLNEKAGLHT
jgi:hypothetical protein